MESLTACEYRPSVIERLRRLKNSFRWRLQQALFRAAMNMADEGNYLRHAERELKAAGYDLDEKEEGPNKWIVQNLFDLLRVFGMQGHSGASAPYCIGMFKKLASFEPLRPLTGDDSEWVKLDYGSDPHWQNVRASHVFKDADGRAYDINGRIFREPDGCCYTSRDSRVYIEFPYTPKSEYVDVPKSE